MGLDRGAPTPASLTLTPASLPLYPRVPPSRPRYPPLRIFLSPPSKKKQDCKTERICLLDPMDIVRNLTGPIQAACGLRTAPHIDHMGVSKPGPHGPVWTLRNPKDTLMSSCVHVAKIQQDAHRPPVFISSQEGDFVWTSHGLPVRTAFQSKKISNDQELIQSDPTPCPQNQKGNN